MISKPYAFINVNIIPMDEERIFLDQTLIAQNGHITQIGDSTHIPIPDDAIQIDATGQYMIPALTDMHIHLEGQAWNIMFPPEAQFTAEDLDFEAILFPYLANGITTVQVMSALPSHIDLRDRIARGEIHGPRLILNRMIDGTGQAWPPPISTWVGTPEEASQAVLEAKQSGYDGMKVYSFLSQECYDAILTTAKQVGMPVSGHIPEALSLEYILEAGQDLIAHAEEVMKHAGGDYSSEQIEAYAAMIAESDTWITPTLTTSRKILAIFDDLEVELARPEVRSMHPMALGVWSYLTENMYLKIPPAHQQAIREGFESFQRPFTKALHDQGVKLLAGTDSLIPTNVPGYSIHDELEELVSIGMSPFEALKTATIHPMAYLGEMEDAGTVAVGKRADLVLLGANPLEDISSTLEVMGVLCTGKWFDRADIRRRMGDPTP